VVFLFLALSFGRAGEFALHILEAHSPSGFRHSLFSGAKEAAPGKELKQWLNPSRERWNYRIETNFVPLKNT
jgi:hypothetical protein